MTPYRSQAHRTLRIPIWTVQLVLMLLSAAIVTAAAWFVLSAFLAMGTYIQTVLP